VTGSGISVFLHTLVLLHEQAVRDNVGHARAVQDGQCGVIASSLTEAATHR
jgi:hypothetical protein